MTAPFRRRSSFQLFKDEQVPAFLKNNPQVKTSDFSAVSREMSKLWSALDSQEKDRYKELARILQLAKAEKAERSFTRAQRSRSPRVASRRIGPSPRTQGVFPLDCGHMTNDLREECPHCLQHYQKRERERIREDGGGGKLQEAGPAARIGQHPRPSDLSTASATDMPETAGGSQVDDSQAPLALVEESQVGA